VSTLLEARDLVRTYRVGEQPLDAAGGIESWLLLGPYEQGVLRPQPAALPSPASLAQATGFVLFGERHVSLLAFLFIPFAFLRREGRRDALLLAALGLWVLVVWLFATQHNARFMVPAWPFAGLAAIREASLVGGRVDVHVLKDWCWLGTARDDGELAQLIELPPRPEFDPDIARLLIRAFRRGKPGFMAVG